MSPNSKPSAVSLYFFSSDTTGEKDFEEFYTADESLDIDRFKALGVIKNDPIFDQAKLELFSNTIAKLRRSGRWTRGQLIDLFNTMISEFKHKETGKFLDGRM